MSAMLEVDDLRVRYRAMGRLRALMSGVSDPFIDAVCHVSLKIDEGETLALVGESGSGKSTIARALMGLVPAHSGSIRFKGEELTGLSQSEFNRFRRKMAMIFQDPIGSLSPRQTVRKLLMEPFRIHRIKDRDAGAEADRLLGLVGLPVDFGQRYPHQLSGGQARRVGVARALATGAELIIADEPTAGLDVSVQGEVLNLLVRLQDEMGISVLIITHNLNIVRHTTDRMAIMYLGRFVEQGPTDEIFRQPRHPYTRALLSANPVPDPDAVIDRAAIRGEVPSLMRRPDGCEFHTRCPRAQDLCHGVAPEVTVEPPAHAFTCHFPLETRTLQTVS